MARTGVAPDPLRRIRVYLLLLLALGVLAVGVTTAAAYLSLPNLGLSFGSGDRVAGVDPAGPAGSSKLRLPDWTGVIPIMITPLSTLRTAS